jgi:hypothetical protein
MADIPDYTGLYNTQLTPQQQVMYEQWRAKLTPDLQNARDYDLQGAYLAGVHPSANEHLPDKFKKPNHPTFSNQSIYSTPRFGTQGGQWKQIPGGTQGQQRWEFIPGPTNAQIWPQAALQQYMQANEKGNILLPGAYGDGQ